MKLKQWGTSLGKAAVVSAWLLAQGDGVPAVANTDFTDSSRGAAAFVQTAGHAPMTTDPAGVYLVENSVLPDSRIELGIDSAIDPWHRSLGAISGFSSLEDDWDGDGAAAPLSGVIHGAMSLALHLRDSGAAVPNIVHVGVNGTVYFEWRNAGGNTEVEVVSPVEAIVRWFPKDEPDAMVFTLKRDA